MQLLDSAKSGSGDNEPNGTDRPVDTRETPVLITTSLAPYVRAPAPTYILPAEQSPIERDHSSSSANSIFSCSTTDEDLPPYSRHAITPTTRTSTTTSASGTSTERNQGASGPRRSFFGIKTEPPKSWPPGPKVDQRPNSLRGGAGAGRGAGGGDRGGVQGHHRDGGRY